MNVKVCGGPGGRNALAALRVALEVVIERIGDPVWTITRCRVAGHFPGLAGKEGSGFLLSLREGESRQAVWVTRVVRRPEGLIVLSSCVVAEPTDPSAAVGAAPIPKGASSRDYGPIGFPA